MTTTILTLIAVILITVVFAVFLAIVLLAVIFTIDDINNHTQLPEHESKKNN